MAAANKLVNYITKISRKTYKKNTELKSFKNIGSFGSIFDLSQLRMKNPIIVSSTDGVGSKLEIANKFKISPRHVGQICSQNKLLLIIPCHRVIKSDGTLGGFTSLGGAKLKKKMLDFEKI